MWPLLIKKKVEKHQKVHRIINHLYIKSNSVLLIPKVSKCLQIFIHLNIKENVTCFQRAGWPH